LNAQERNLRSSLTAEETKLIETKRFSICDIVWKRTNEDYIESHDPREVIRYYEDLQDWLLILNSNKDYTRACMIAIRIQFIDACGIDCYPTKEKNQWCYSVPENMVIVNTGSQYLAKSIRLSRITENDVLGLLKQGFNAMRPKVPFSYVDLDSFQKLVSIIMNDLKNKKSLKCELNEFFPTWDYSKLIANLKAQPGLIITGEVVDEDYHIDFSKMPANYGLENKSPKLAEEKN
jgi:hypothetical protein